MKKSVKLLSLILALIMIISALPFSAAADEPSMKIYGIYLSQNSSQDIEDDDNDEVEYGDAVLLESNGEYLLMDAGAEYTSNSLVSYLQNIGLTKETPLTVYISHLHSDHIGGLAAIAENFTIKRLYLPDYKTIGTEYENKSGYNITEITRSVIRNRANIDEPLEPEDTKGGEIDSLLGSGMEGKDNEFIGNDDIMGGDEYQGFNEGGSEGGSEGEGESEGGSEGEGEGGETEPKERIVHYLEKGSTFSIGSVEAEVLGPVGTHHPSDYNGNKMSHYLNDCSLTTLFTCGETKFLTTGDIESAEERALIDEYGKSGKLCSDILKMPHHGLTSTSNTEDFFAAVKAKYFFAENMGYGTTVSNGKTVWKNHTAIDRAQKWGLPYMVGTEEAPFVIKLKNGKTTLYRDKNLNGAVGGSETFEGWIEVEGIAQKPEGESASKPNYTGKNKYYFDENGNILTGVQIIGGKAYLFNEGGAMEKGHYEFENGKWVYKNARRYNDGKDLRDFEESGEMAIGFGNFVSNGKSYYCYHEPSTGFRKLGNDNWDIFDILGKKYAINANGVIFNNEGAGGLKSYTVSGKTRYRLFGKDGAMQTGFIETESSGKPILCYYQPSDGFRKTGSKNWDIYEINKKKYAINENGVIFNNNGKGGLKTYKINKKTCYRHFNSKGVMTTGFKDLSGATYYFNPKTGLRETGFKCIDGKYYYFNEYGKLQKGKTVSVGGVKCTFNKKGVMTSPLPAKPKNLKVKAKSKGKNTVSWDKVKNASGYYILRSTSKSGTYKSIKTITKGSTKTYTDTSASSKKTYYYKVQAYRKISGVKVKGRATSAKSVKTK